MKILTKEEEEAHYNATLKGGIKGGLIGLALVCTFPPAEAKVKFPKRQQLTLTRVEQQPTAHTSASPPSAASPSP